MSGGIDSSVVAHLLRELKHDVVGVRFTLWTDPLAPPLAEVLPTKCCSAQTAYRASKVASDLCIPLHVIDLQEEFKRAVVDPFLAGHRRGLTPNPCIGCNRMMKFGKLLELADALGCDKLATGHYARVATERLPNGDERTLLLEAIDATKDQSYYLYSLSQPQLQRALFPLGAMRKRTVYALARHYGVPLPAHYRESQDLCFFPEKTPRMFLKRHLRDVLAPGPIVHRDGTVVGTHEGLPLYTIGQRRGLKIGGLNIPLEVVAKQPATNRLIVDERGASTQQETSLIELNFLSWKPMEAEPTLFECRTRSLSPRSSGWLTYTASLGRFTFRLPHSPLAPGQSLVLYRGEEIVGGGIVAQGA